jgi:hypothetical protein
MRRVKDTKSTKSTKKIVSSPRMLSRACALTKVSNSRPQTDQRVYKGRIPDEHNRYHGIHSQSAQGVTLGVSYCRREGRT